MAIINWNNGKPSFDYANNAALGVNLSRQVNAPLDVSSEFSSIKDMLYYVTEGRYPANGVGVSAVVKADTFKKYPYLGQIITLINTEDETVGIYYIKTAEYDSTLSTDEDVFNHYFEAVGKATIGDNKSINFDTDTGILSLNDFGKRYYRYDVEKNQYATIPTEGWIDGLIPVVSNEKLIWREPNPITVEGLQTKITTIESTLNTKVDAVDGYGLVGIDKDSENPEKITLKNSNNLVENLQIYSVSGIDEVLTNKADKLTTYTKDETDSKIANAITSMGTVFEFKQTYTEEDFNKLAGAVPNQWADGSNSKVGDVILVKITNKTGEDIAKEYVVVQNGDSKRFELMGDPSGVTALAGRVSTLEGSSATLTDNFNTLNDKVTNETTGLEKKVSDLTTSVGVNTQNINTLNDKITNETTGLEKKVSDLTTSVGTNTQNINIINEAIGDDTKGLKRDVKALKETVGDATSGLVKDNTENKTAIANINTKLGEGFETGAQVNKIESIVLGTGITGEVVVDAKKATINVTNVSKSAKADVADATTGTLTIGGKTFNGAQDVSVATSDIVGTATETDFGLVKGHNPEQGYVTVMQDGTMYVSSVSKANAADNATSADKVKNALKFGSKTYDGSTKDVEITLTDLGFDGSQYATSEQGRKADESIKTIKITKSNDETGVSFSVNNREATISNEDLSRSLGLGSAAFTDSSSYASKSIEGTFVDLSSDQQISGNKTFLGKVNLTVEPTTDSEATTKKYVDSQISTKMSAIDSMTFKGLLGGEGNIQILPTSNVKNGDTYKVALAGKYNGEENAKAGDMYIALVSKIDEAVTIQWQLIPSADDGNVLANETLTNDAIVLGSGNQSIKTLTNGSNGDILTINDGRVSWHAPEAQKTTTIKTNDEISATGAVTGENTEYTLSIVNMSTDKLTQGTNVLVFDCGDSNF